jgi:hypothetical protein
VLCPQALSYRPPAPPEFADIAPPDFDVELHPESASSINAAVANVRKDRSSD